MLLQILVGSHFGWGHCRNGHVPLNAVPSGCIDTPYIYHNTYNESFHLGDSNEILVDISKYIAKEIKVKKTEVSETLTCKVCMEKKVEILMSPCNHAILCSECFESLKDNDKRCPYCRRTFDSGSNIFYWMFFRNNIWFYLIYYFNYIHTLRVRLKRTFLLKFIKVRNKKNCDNFTNSIKIK